MILRQTTEIDIDPQDIADNQSEANILEFIKGIDEALENESFTIMLAVTLLESIDCPQVILNEIQIHFNRWAID